MENFVKTIFKPLMEKAENLDSQIPKLVDSEPVLEALFKVWNNTVKPSIHDVKQRRWITTIRAIFEKLKEARKNKILSEALHELIISIAFTAIQNGSIFSGRDRIFAQKSISFCDREIFKNRRHAKAKHGSTKKKRERI